MVFFALGGPDRQRPGQAEAHFEYAAVGVARCAYPRVERKAVAYLPNRACERRIRGRHVPLALDVQLADGAHDPVARTLGDDTGEAVKVMVPRDCGGGVEMERERSPLVRVDQVYLRAEVAVAAQL